MVNKPIDWTEQLQAEWLVAEYLKDEAAEIKRRGGSAKVVLDYVDFLFDSDARAVKLLKLGLFPAEELPLRQTTISLAAVVSMISNRRKAKASGETKEIAESLHRAETAFLFSWLHLDDAQIAEFDVDEMARISENLKQAILLNPNLDLPKTLENLPQREWAMGRWRAGETALETWRETDPMQFSMQLFEI